MRKSAGSGPARIRAMVAATATIAIGLGVRAGLAGDVAKYAGIAAYAVLVYCLVVLVAPAVRAAIAAAATTALCWAVELWQLTPIPARLSADNALARLVLGSTFNPPDLLWYLIGAGFAAVVHFATRSRPVVKPASPAPADSVGERVDEE